MNKKYNKNKDMADFHRKLLVAELSNCIIGLKNN